MNEVAGEDAAVTLSGEGGIVLSEPEVGAVARRLVARFVASEARSGGIEWEDHPGFAERTWEAIEQAIDAYADDLTAVAGRFDEATDIDSIYLLERAND